MRGDFYKQLTSNLETARAEGLFKEERIITSAQQADITVGDSHVINFCANNYLGLANHPELIAAAKSGMDSHGFGMASVRFICGTQDTHKQLEKKLADFLGMEDAILYSSCFDANGGLFETLLGPEDAIISDALNHASIIDGVRLCKAKRFRYANNDMQELEARLKEARAKRWLSGCASAPVRICSPTLWRRPSWPPPSKCWRWLKRGQTCAIACGLTRVCSAKK